MEENCIITCYGRRYATGTQCIPYAVLLKHD